MLIFQCLLSSLLSLHILILLCCFQQPQSTMSTNLDSLSHLPHCTYATGNGTSLFRGPIRTLNVSCTKMNLLPLTTNMLLVVFSYQAPLSMGLSRKGCWSGLPFPSPSLLALLYKFKSFQAVEHLCVTRDVSNIIN